MSVFKNVFTQSIFRMYLIAILINIFNIFIISLKFTRIPLLQFKKYTTIFFIAYDSHND